VTNPEKIRCLQQMVFQTQAGEFLRDLFYISGHFDHDLHDEQARIEYNLTKRLMAGCGITVQFKPVEIREIPPDANLTDVILEQGDKTL
jgi:hypothetical protein